MHFFWPPLHASTSRSVRSLLYLSLSFARPLFLPLLHRRLSLRPLTAFAMYHAKPQPVGVSKVLIFGAGNFGSCLASHLGDSQHDVYMWAREEKTVTYFNQHRRNPVYLKDHQFPKNITAVGPELPSKEFIEEMDVVLFAMPTQFLR